MAIDQTGPEPILTKSRTENGEAGSERELTVEQLAMHIAIAMAADSRHAPILRGRHSPVDPQERDRVRGEFAAWLARRILAGNLIVTRRPPSSHGAFPQVKQVGTPPQMRGI